MCGPELRVGSWQYCKLKEGFQGLSGSKAYSFYALPPGSGWPEQHCRRGEGAG